MEHTRQQSDLNNPQPTKKSAADHGQLHVASAHDMDGKRDDEQTKSTEGAQKRQTQTGEAADLGLERKSAEQPDGNELVWYAALGQVPGRSQANEQPEN